MSLKEEPSCISNASPPTTATTTTTTTPTKSPAKQLPGKIAKKVKGVLHHVLHPHHHRVQTPSFSVTSPSSPIFYPINVVRAFLPPDQSSTTGSVHSGDTWDDKYAKEVDSIDEPPTDHSIDLSMSVANPSITYIYMSDEHHLPREEPQLNLHEQDTSASDPMVTGPIIPDHHSIDLSMPVADSSTTHIDISDEHHLPQEEHQLNLNEKDASASDPTITSPIEPETSDHHSIDLSTAADSSTPHINTSDEHHLPQEEPQLNLHENDTSTSDPTVTSPIEPENPDPILTDDKEEEDSLSKEEADEEKADASSEQVVSPSQAIPLDLSEAKEEASSDANSEQIVSPSQAVPLHLSSPEVKEEASSDANSEPVVSPSQAVPLDTSEAKVKASSDTNSEPVVLPSQTVPLDLSSPEASIPQSQAPLPNLQKAIPPPPESEKEDVSDSYVAAPIVPPTFLPIQIVRRLFSPNLLTWWLPFSPLSLPPVPRYFGLIPKILTGRRLLLLMLLLLIRDSTAPFAAVETLALFATV